MIITESNYDPARLEAVGVVRSGVIDRDALATIERERPWELETDLELQIQLNTLCSIDVEHDDQRQRCSIIERELMRRSIAD